MFKTILRGVSLFALLALAAGTARATPDEDARAHFQAIAASDVGQLMADYADQAWFSWVGGRLDGEYSGTQAIQDMWTKFATAQGRLTFTVSDVQSSANPSGATVTANVHFASQTNANIKVRYVLTYRAGKIVGEVWQNDPNL